MSSNTRVLERLKLQHCSDGAVQLSTVCEKWRVQKEQFKRSRTLSKALKYNDDSDAELQVPEGYAAAWVEFLELNDKDRSIPTASLPRCSQAVEFFADDIGIRNICNQLSQQLFTEEPVSEEQAKQDEQQEKHEEAEEEKAACPRTEAVPQPQSCAWIGCFRPLENKKDSGQGSSSQPEGQLEREDSLKSSHAPQSRKSKQDVSHALDGIPPHFVQRVCRTSGKPLHEQLQVLPEKYHAVAIVATFPGTLHSHSLALHGRGEGRWPSAPAAQTLFHAVSKLSGLRSLSIDCYLLKKVLKDFSVLRKLGHSLACLQSLRHLELLRVSGEVPGLESETIWAAISTLAVLKSLRITDANLTWGHAKHILILLPRMAALQHLIIRPSATVNIKTAHLVFRGELLFVAAGMTHLEHVELGCYGAFSSSNLNMLGQLQPNQGLFQPARLQRLEISHCELWDKFAACLKLPGLTRLALTGLSKECSGLGTLSRALACMAALRELVITGRGPNTESFVSRSSFGMRGVGAADTVKFENEAFAISSALSQMPQLRMINFSGTDIFESAVMLFTMGVKTLSSLRHLHLDVGNCTGRGQNYLNFQQIRYTGSESALSLHEDGLHSAFSGSRTAVSRSAASSMQAGDAAAAATPLAPALVGVQVVASNRGLKPVTTASAECMHALCMHGGNADAAHMPPSKNFPFKYFSSVLKQLTQVTCLVLEHPIGADRAGALATALPNLKSLQHLELDLKPETAPSAPTYASSCAAELTAVASAIYASSGGSLRFLKLRNVNAWACSDCNSGIMALSVSIYKLTSLRRLHLDFLCASTETNHGLSPGACVLQVPRVLQTLQNLRNLEDLTLTYSCMQQCLRECDRYGGVLLGSIPHLTHLRHLKVHVTTGAPTASGLPSPCSGDHSHKEASLKLLQNLPELQVLDLQGITCMIGDPHDSCESAAEGSEPGKSCVALGSTLQPLTNLKCLRLHACNLATPEATAIADAVLHMKVLEALDLGGNPGITLSSAEKIAEAMSEHEFVDVVQFSGVAREALETTNWTALSAKYPFVCCGYDEGVDYSRWVCDKGLSVSAQRV